MFRARGIGLALLSLLALLATESPCRAEDPAPNGAASAPAWVPFTLSPEQPPSSLPPGTGPVEKLVDDFFGQLVSAVAEYPGNYFTLAVPDFADR